jgi:hypothetical protein
MLQTNSLTCGRNERVAPMRCYVDSSVHAQYKIGVLGFTIDTPWNRPILYYKELRRIIGGVQSETLTAIWCIHEIRKFYDGEIIMFADCMDVTKLSFPNVTIKKVRGHPAKGITTVVDYYQSRFYDLDNAVRDKMRQLVQLVVWKKIQRESILTAREFGRLIAKNSSDLQTVQLFDIQTKRQKKQSINHPKPDEHQRESQSGLSMVYRHTNLVTGIYQIEDKKIKFIVMRIIDQNKLEIVFDTIDNNVGCSTAILTIGQYGWCIKYGNHVGLVKFYGTL